VKYVDCVLQDIVMRQDDAYGEIHTVRRTGLSPTLIVRIGARLEEGEVMPNVLLINSLAALGGEDEAHLEMHLGESTRDGNHPPSSPPSSFHSCTQAAARNRP
jgi:hypothetical protein